MQLQEKNNIKYAFSSFLQKFKVQSFCVLIKFEELRQIYLAGLNSLSYYLDSGTIIEVYLYKEFFQLIKLKSSVIFTMMSVNVPHQHQQLYIQHFFLFKSHQILIQFLYHFIV